MPLTGIFIQWENIPTEKRNPLIKACGRERRRCNSGRSLRVNRPGYKKVEKKRKKGALIAEWRLLLLTGTEQVAGYYSSTKGLYKSTLKASFCKIWTNISKSSNIDLSEQWTVTKVEAKSLTKTFESASVKLLIDNELWTSYQTVTNSQQLITFNK